MFCFFFDVLTFYLPPIEENRRFKKPRSCILRDRSLLQLTEVSDVYRHWPITFLSRSTGHRITPTSFGLALANYSPGVNFYNERRLAIGSQFRHLRCHSLYRDIRFPFLLLMKPPKIYGSD